MALLDSDFDAGQVDPNFNFSAIPNGTYKAVITASERKDARSGNGAMLKMTFEIIEGEYRGSKVFTNLNLWNANSTAKSIAQKELSAICRAVGNLRPGDSAELHNTPLYITVVCEKRQDRPDEMSNRIKEYASISQARQPAPTSNFDQAPYKRGPGTSPGGGAWGGGNPGTPNA